MQAEQLGARVARACGGGDAITLAGQKPRQQVADAAIVVDQQQMRGVVGQLLRCPRGGCGDGCSLRHGHSLGFLLPVPKIASNTLSGSSRSIMARRNWLITATPSGLMSRSALVMRSVCSPASFATKASPLGVA